MHRPIKVRMNPDGGATLTIPKDYMGHCHCGKEARHKEYMEFETPVKSDPTLGLPDIRGITHFVCDDHVKN